MKLATLLVTIFAVFAAHTSIAEVPAATTTPPPLEPVAQLRFGLSVAPSADANPRKRRGLKIQLQYSFLHTPMNGAIRVYWIGKGTDGQLAVTGCEKLNYTFSPGGYVSTSADSGAPDASRPVHLEGWVVTVREDGPAGTLGQLLAVKGSSAAFERLARTRGALSEKPALITAAK